MIFSLVGDRLDFKLNRVNIQYNPFIESQTGTYNDSFDDSASPWIKMGTWEKVASAVSISNGNLNISHIGSELASLYVEPPVGAVTDFELSFTGTGTMNDGSFGVWRVYGYNYYTGMWVEDDLLKVGYLAGSGIAPIAVNSAPVVLQGITWIKFVTTRSWNTIDMSVYGDNLLLLSGSYTTADSRLHSGHVVFGVDVRDSVNMHFSAISLPYNKFTTDIKDESIPTLFSLQQNYPNPFNPATVIEYELTKSSDVRLDVFDVNGRKCATLVNGHLQSGKHSVGFDGLKFASGVYFYQLVADGSIQTRKMVLVR